VKSKNKLDSIEEEKQLDSPDKPLKQTASSLLRQMTATQYSAMSEAENEEIVSKTVETFKSVA